MENWHALVEACLLMIMSAEGYKSDVNHNDRLDQLVNHQIEKPFPYCIRQFWVRFKAECEQTNRNDEWSDERAEETHQYMLFFNHVGVLMHNGRCSCANNSNSGTPTGQNEDHV